MGDVVIGSVLFAAFIACMVLANEERLQHETLAKHGSYDRPRLRKIAGRWATTTVLLRMASCFVAFAFWWALNYQASRTHDATLSALAFLSFLPLGGIVFGAGWFVRWRLYKVLPEEKAKAEERKRPGGDAKP